MKNRLRLLSIIMLFSLCANMLVVYGDEADINIILETNSEQSIITAVCSADYDSLVWEKSDSADGYFDEILASYDNTYTPCVDDAGKYIRVKISLGAEEYYSEAARVVPEYAVKDEFDSDAEADLEKWALVSINDDYTAGVSELADGTGYFYISRIGNAGTAYGQATRNFTAIDKKTIIESRFRNDGGQSNVFYVKSGGSPAMNMNIPDAHIKATYGNGSGGVATSVVVDNYSTDMWYDLKLVINPVGNTANPAVDIYTGTDGSLEPVCRGVPMRSAVSNINNIWFAKIQTGTFMLDYLRVYSDVKVILPEISDEKSVELDAKLLSFDMLTSQSAYTVTENLTLPASGTYGSSIVWESDNPQSVSDDGTVMRDSTEYVTLRATVTKGDSEAVREFSFIVLKNPDSESVPLIDMNFDDGEHSFVTTPAENAVVEDGVLKIHNNASPLEATGDVKLTFGKINKNVFIEGDIKLTSNSGNIFYIRDGGATAVNFNYSGGTLNCRHGDMTIDGASVGVRPVVSGISGKWFTLKVFMDFASQKCDVYVDGKKIISGADFRSSASGVDTFIFGKPLAGEGNIYLDNIRVYEPEADLEAVMSDVALPEAAEDSFELPGEADGARIKWISLDENYICVDGNMAIVSRPSVYEEDVLVKLVGVFESDVAVDSKVYDITVCREYTDTEAVEKAAEAFVWADISDDVIDAVKGDFHLPETLKNGVSVSYRYDKDGYVSGNKVSRPLSEDVTVKLTVVFERNGKKAEKAFVFTLLNLRDDGEINIKELMEEDVNSIDLGKLSAVTEDLKLPEKGDNGTSFVWESGNERVISSDGTVYRDSESKSVYLTVSAELLGEKCQKSFYVTVKGTGSSGGSGGGSSGGGRGSGTKGGYSVGAVSGGAASDVSQPPVPASDIFVDTDSVAWAKDAIVSLVKKGVVSVNVTKTFEPARCITREEAVKMIVVAFGVEAEGNESKFIDSEKTAWYYPYVTAAENAGIVNGVSSDRFGISQNITRQDSAVMLYNALKKISGADEINDASLSFGDAEDIASYASEAVAYFSSKGIINGYADNTFLPKNSITRAEFAAVLARLLDSIG